MKKHLSYWHKYLRELGCIVCGGKAQIHHCRSGSMSRNGYLTGGAQKQNDWLVLPLCLTHHTGGQGIHQIGVVTWENTYGNQLSLLLGLDYLHTDIDLFAWAGVPRPGRSEDVDWLCVGATAKAMSQRAYVEIEKLPVVQNGTD